MLAEKLGRTVAELRCSMSQAEFVEWIGFYRWREREAAKANKKAGHSKPSRGLGGGR